MERLPTVCCAELNVCTCCAQIEANFDEQEAVKCLYWIKLMTDVDEIAGDAESIDGSHDAFYQVLGDGMVLCK